MYLEKKKISRRDVLKGAAIGAGAVVSAGMIEDMREDMTPNLEKNKTPFEKKYGSMEAIGGAQTDIIDVQPEAMSDKPPLLVAPGFGASIHTDVPLLEMLAKGGRRILSLNHPQTRRIINLPQSEQEEASGFPRTELRKASNLLELIEKRGIEGKVDVLAFSEGALNTLLAAHFQPEKFNSIIISAPAGLIGRDSLIGLIRRFRSQAKSDDTVGIPSVKNFDSSFPELAAEERAMLEQIAKTWKEDEAAAWKYPIHTAEDLWAIAHMRIDDLVASARKAGITVAVISGVDDQVFPAKTMAERMPKDSLDGFISVRGAHGPQYSARVVDYLFDLLDAKREKVSAGVKESH